MADNSLILSILSGRFSDLENNLSSLSYPTNNLILYVLGIVLPIILFKYD